MDRYIVADIQPVSIGQLHIVEALEVAAAGAEHVMREDPTEQYAELEILPQHTLVEHLPQPDQRLELLEARPVDVGVVLRLQRDIACIHLQYRDTRSGWKLLQDRIPVLRIVELCKNSTADAVA